MDKEQGSQAQRPETTVRVTDLSEPELASFLVEFGRVAGLEGAAALEAADLLVWSILTKHGPHETPPGLADFLNATAEPSPVAEDAIWEARQLETDVRRLRAQTARWRAALEQPESLQGYEAGVLRGDIEELGGYLSGPAPAELHDAMREALSEARAVADRLEAAGHEGAIRRALSRPIHSASSVTAILAAVDRASEHLAERGTLTAELSELARQAKERAARYRSQKKLDEADVAVAGGNAKKASRLRAEAEVCLAQDWGKAFPGGPVPG